MKVLVISGPSSNSGKTTLACSLLPLLPGKWGAIKWTKLKKENQSQLPPGAKYAILKDTKLIEQEGKDTGKYLSAGAWPVYWVIGSERDYSQIWEELKHELSFFSLSGVVIEGYSCVNFIPEKLLVFSINLEVPYSLWKKDWSSLLGQAQYLHLYPSEKEAIFTGFSEVPRLRLEDSSCMESFLSILG